ncbi:hypothetical protein RFI_24966 [Reticulomyxa filosa]|uniref:Proteasome subunit beta n=1 Tax=Reticulomyxa filosa TaxID=46433 RepID=X6MEW7_RETFI|nr:hypothetical protein RFI_24966 [Reticulomyxa filosa]|eukprot:ETO12409.1 hypothetical protein RFI_24966 [Reticulomyxa filosa]
MDAAFGFVGKDYALVVCDCAVPRSIVVMKQFEDKIAAARKKRGITQYTRKQNNILIGKVFELIFLIEIWANKYRNNFSEYIQRNLKWYEMRNGRKLSNHAIAHFTRNELATALRSSPYMVNLLQAGYDAKAGPCLYYIDYLASLQKVDKAAHGYCAFFLLSLFDRHWKKDMNLEDGLKLVDMCIKQLNNRFLINMKKFVVKIVDKDGTREISREAPREHKDEDVEMKEPENKLHRSPSDV